MFFDSLAREVGYGKGDSLKGLVDSTKKWGQEGCMRNSKRDTIMVTCVDHSEAFGGQQFMKHRDVVVKHTACCNFESFCRYQTTLPCPRKQPDTFGP